MRRVAFDRVEEDAGDVWDWRPPGKVREPGVLYYSRRDGQLKWVSFICPCGCEKGSGEGWVAIPVGPEHKSGSCWGAMVRDGKLTLNPSIARTGQTCRAHFFIRDNRVDWC